MKQNLTTLGSTHHFLQGAAQVSAACQPFRCLGLSCSFVEYKGSSWKFFLGTRSSSRALHPPPPSKTRICTGSIPFPFLLSHEEQVISLSGSPSLWGSSEFRADIASRIALKGQSLCFLSSTSFFTQLRFHFLAIPTGDSFDFSSSCFPDFSWSEIQTLFNKEKYWAIILFKESLARTHQY